MACDTPGDLQPFMIWGLVQVKRLSYHLHVCSSILMYFAVLLEEMNQIIVILCTSTRCSELSSLVCPCNEHHMMYGRYGDADHLRLERDSTEFEEWDRLFLERMESDDRHVGEGIGHKDCTCARQMRGNPPETRLVNPQPRLRHLTTRALTVSLPALSSPFLSRRSLQNLCFKFLLSDAAHLMSMHPTAES